MKMYVGIHIAKLSHFAAAISSDGEIIIEPVSYTHLDVYKRQLGNRHKHDVHDTDTAYDQ